jgi:Ala-tRNA(Pro) deacylase
MEGAMPVEHLETYLNDQDVRYVTISHSPAYTAMEIAHAAHVPGKELAKTVIVKLDGEMAMAVLPATEQLDLERLRDATGANLVELADESDFAPRFPDCEAGAMPPFGNLWDMDVFVDQRLREDEKIAFNAGNHRELIQLTYSDFERLVQPTVLEIGVPA